ncbi:helix-turn-helix domain-containing protein [Streptomyces sp. NPDC057654]|uniref:helix-turn-helix domain-containing protein n=1 Tax=Streptomyces sp. NPDC057654 TaxID=3346196 RepID=UPI00367837C5
MNWQSSVIRDVSSAGDYGKVIELVRKQARMTQRQLGEACGLSQSAISRLERRGPGSYGTDILSAVAASLEIPPQVVGLADKHALRGGKDPLERRGFLGNVAAAAASPLLGVLPEPDGAASQAAALRLNTATYRRLDGSTPSRDLADAVESHIRLIQNISRDAARQDARVRLAAVASEAASFAGWLAWDMGDHGSARRWYGSATRAARAFGDPLLAAYQTGSQAQFEAHVGNGFEALNLVRNARRYLADTTPAVADAWLASVEALAHAANGNERGTDHSLVRSRGLVERLSTEEPPPWPWMFPFDVAKVAACRTTCGARLGLPQWVFAAGTEAPANGNAKLRALAMLDLAAGHLAARRTEAAFALASRAVGTGLQYKSGRVVERARAMRRPVTFASPPKVVRDFDERLHGVHI